MITGTGPEVRSRPSPRVGRALLLGTVAIGVLDGLDAAIFFGLRGVPVERIFQAIAAGLLGREAFVGGIGTALLGVGLHFLIAFGIVATFTIAARRFPALLERPLLVGPAYGVLVYLVMNYGVIPLSAAASGPKPTAVLVNGVLIHVFGVGIPAVLAARTAFRSPRF